MLLIEPAVAQTEWKDRPVTLAIDDQKNPQIALPADKDYTIIVWEDYRHGDADLYVQTRHTETPVYPIISASTCGRAALAHPHVDHSSWR